MEIDLDVFESNIALIEHHVGILLRNSDDGNSLRVLHTSVGILKQEASLNKIVDVTTLILPLADIISNLNSRVFSFSPAISEVILMTLDRVYNILQLLISNKPGDFSSSVIIAKAISSLATSNKSNADSNAQNILLLVSGTSKAPHSRLIQKIDNDIVSTHASESELADLRLFKNLNVVLEKRSSFWTGRTARILHLAFLMNKAAGDLVDPIQLEAAIYMHDIGMGLLAESIISKQDKLNRLELKELHNHPIVGGELLNRMPNWTDAAQMVLQHHEQPNGAGYPHGLKDEETSPGAKLLATLDAFEAMTHERINRAHKKSVVRAMVELNACEDQFSRQWIPVLNQVVRELLENE